MTQKDEATANQDETKGIAQLIDRLVMRFPQLSASTVEEAVSGAHRQFDDARVRDFVPLLVEHEALNTLRDLAGKADLADRRDTEAPELALDSRS